MSFFQDNCGQAGAISDTSTSKIFERCSHGRNRKFGSAETEFPEELERDYERVRGGETEQETKIFEQGLEGQQGAGRIKSGRLETGLRLPPLPKILRLELQPGEDFFLFDLNQ